MKQLKNLHQEQPIPQEEALKERDALLNNLLLQEYLGISSKEIIIKGIPPTSDDLFYLDWGRETVKESLSFVNEVLRQLVTLNTALLAGSIIIFDVAIIQELFKYGAILVFFLSLIVSFVGVFPYEGMIDITMPNEVKAYKIAALQWKRRYLRVSSLLMLGGFALVLIGIFRR